MTQRWSVIGGMLCIFFLWNGLIWAQEPTGDLSQGGAAAQGRPPPERMSGIARPETADPSGQVTVRVLQGSWDANVKNASVHLVGYHSDGTTTYIVRQTDAGGRAQFEGLAGGGHAAYYALVVLPRGEQRDRLLSRPIVLAPNVGMRLILSGKTKQDTSPPLDQLKDYNIGAKGSTPPPGQIQVFLSGLANTIDTVQLVRLSDKKVIEEHSPTKEEVQAQASGKQVSPPTWGVLFRNPGDDLQSAYLVQGKNSQGDMYRSVPFLFVPGTGAVLSVVIYPGLMFRFRLEGKLNDTYMNFGGLFALNNISYAPYMDKSGGVLIPLPTGFAGAQVAEEYQDRVTIDRERGFVWRGSVPPGGIQFHAAYTLPVVEGRYDFDWPLPFGALSSMLLFEKFPGSDVKIADNAQGRIQQDRQGRQYYRLDDINIAPKQRMVMHVSGLPRYPQWKRVVQYCIGVIVLGLLVWALWVLLLQPSGGSQSTQQAQKEHWLEELARLEAKFQCGDITKEAYESQKNYAKTHLEQVWDADGGSRGNHSTGNS